MAATPPPSRKRVPANERRDAIIEAAVRELEHGGLHGTPVERIAKRVGVTQPYVFSLFGGKRELFLAAVERNFAHVAAVFRRAAGEFDAENAEPGEDIMAAMGKAYIEMLDDRREYLLLQHHAYAACDDDVIREHVRTLYAGLVELVAEVSGLSGELLDEFFRYGMWLNVAAAMGVEDLRAGCEWMVAKRAAGSAAVTAAE